MSEEISLFNAGDQPGGHFKQPLADRMRPRNLAEMVGQEHLLAPANRSARSSISISRSR